MEIEVKLRLPSAEDHRRFSEALAEYRQCTHLQENAFFDGAGGELSSRLVVVGARFYDGDDSCILFLKAKRCLVGGVSRAELMWEDVDPDVGRACVAEPWRLAETSRSAGSSAFMKRLAEELEWMNVSGEEEEEEEEEEEGGGKSSSSTLVCVGGFCNMRTVYKWNGLKVEVDETRYEFGTSYEVECETTEPEEAKEALEEFMKENAINYSYSESTKYKVFRTGKLMA